MYESWTTRVIKVQGLTSQGKRKKVVSLLLLARKRLPISSTWVYSLPAIFRTLANVLRARLSAPAIQNMAQSFRLSGCT